MSQFSHTPEDASESFDVILIEDDEYDAELTFRFFKKTGLVTNALHFPTAEMALSYLQTATHLPKIALIDLQLSGGMSGLEFLRQLKKTEKTKGIRTAFLTGSVEEQQFIDPFIISTSIFMLKPLTMQKLTQIIADSCKN